MKIVFGLIFLAFTFANAITLDEVIQIAKERSLKIKITEKDLEKVYQTIREVKSNIYPHLTLEASYQKVDPNYITGLSLKNRYRASIKIKQKIFDKAVFESLKVARENIKLQQAIKEDTVVKVIDTAKRLYIASLYYKYIMQERKRSLEYWRKYFYFVENQFKIGLTNKYNYYRTKSQLKLAQAQYKKALYDYKKSLIQMKRFLFLKKIEEPEGKLKILSLDIPDENSLINNTELNVIAQTIKVKNREKFFYKASNWPKLNLNLSYETYNTRDFPSLKETWRKGYVITVSLNWNIFDGFKTQSKVMQSDLEKVKEELKYKDKLNQLREKYETDIEDLKALINQEEAYKDSVKSAQEALNLATEQYKYGLSSIIDVLDAEKNYRNNKINYATIIYQINLKIFDLQLLSGDIE